MNYDGRKFRALSVSENGEVPDNMIFQYQQEGDILTCDYKGGTIVQGHLIGKVDKDGVIDMRYHQVLIDGELQTGICISKPEILADGRIRLHESWKWTSGDFSEGTSLLEEV